MRAPAVQTSCSQAGPCSCSDYRAIPDLDVYDQQNLDDDGEFSDISLSERLAAEREMRKRDRDEGRAEGRMRRGILYGEGTS